MQMIWDLTLLDFFRNIVLGSYKKIQKNRKKFLTSKKECGIIVKLSAGSGWQRSLKIEQQERLYKALRSAKYEISSRRVIYTQQSKRS